MKDVLTKLNLQKPIRLIRTRPKKPRWLNMITSFTWKKEQVIGIIPTTFLKSHNPNFAISKPSMNILSVSSSTIRNKALSMLDFPAPIRPTIPTFLLEKTLKGIHARRVGARVYSVYNTIKFYKSRQRPSQGWPITLK